MGKKLVTREQAAKIALKAEKHTLAYGKMFSIMIDGLYHYGYPQTGFAMLTGKSPLYSGGNHAGNCDWLGMVDADDFPRTTIECQLYPPPDFGPISWGDCSHPDSTVCNILSGSILGILPAKPGFIEIDFYPQPYGLTEVSGTAVTAAGVIKVCYKKVKEEHHFTAKFPAGSKINYNFSALSGTVILNGKIIKEAIL